MKIHTGIDIVEISRIQRLIDNSGNRFIEKHFTEQERGYCLKKGVKHFAGLFAVKEAAFKAMKLKWEEGFSWKNIETFHLTDGVPKLRFYGTVLDSYRGLGNTDIDVSISYSDNIAAAIVTLLQLQD